MKMTHKASHQSSGARRAQAAQSQLQRYVFIALSLSLSFSAIACGPTIKDLESRERALKTSQARVRALSEAKESAARYHTLLKSGRGGALLLSRADLESAASQMLPYVFKGKELHSKYLRGEISIVKVSDLKLLPGNRAQLYLHFDGRKIKTRNVPAIAKGQVKSLKGAVRKGKVLVEVQASINQEKRALVLRPRAVSVKFSKQNTGSNRSRFLDAVNRKIFNRAKRIPLPARLKGPVSALSTPNYLALISR